MTRNIYMAGKISKNDWRSAFVDMRQIGFGMYDQLDQPRFDFPITPMANGHNYTGPYFVSCDHGCYHGDNAHGMGAGIIGCSGDGPTEKDMTRKRVFDACQTALWFSNTVFAWIDSPDCYGTIAEIGLAAGTPGAAFGWKRPDIWISGPQHFDDLWFVYLLADDATFDYSTPEGALNHFLRCHDRIEYRDYILSPEWKARATAAKEAAGWRCQVCNRPSTAVTLDAHHRTYERLGYERPDDITVLCRDCHELYESNRRARKNGRP